MGRSYTNIDSLMTKGQPKQVRAEQRFRLDRTSMAPEGIARNSTYRAEEQPDQLRSGRAHVICAKVSPQAVDCQKGLTRDAANNTITT